MNHRYFIGVMFALTFYIIFEDDIKRAALPPSADLALEVTIAVILVLFTIEMGGWVGGRVGRWAGGRGDGRAGGWAGGAKDCDSLVHRGFRFCVPVGGGVRAGHGKAGCLHCSRGCVL